MASYGYFAGLFGTSSQSSSGLSSLYSNLGQYSIIQNGTYKKLLTAYYKTTSDDTNSSSSTSSISSLVTSSDKSAYTTTTKYASALSSASQALLTSQNASLYDEGNEDELVSKVESFVSSYNTALANAQGSASTTVRSLATGLINTTSSYAKQLEAIGITVNSDNTLSVDTETLKSADKTTIKNVFGSSSSYAGSTMKLAAQISSAATSAANGLTTYSSYGTYASTNIASYYNWYT